ARTTSGPRRSREGVVLGLAVHRSPRRKARTMKLRLPLILSAAALVVSLLGATPLGEAARSTVAKVVPRAKTADFAKNAGRLNGHKSSAAPTAGQIPVL